jgi:hypothetical protein
MLFIVSVVWGACVPHVGDRCLSCGYCVSVKWEKRVLFVGDTCTDGGKHSVLYVG